MSTEHNPITCISGELGVTTYGGGGGPEIQLTFARPVDKYGEEHLNGCNRMNYWFLNLNKEDAKQLVVTLYNFIEDTI